MLNRVYDNGICIIGVVKYVKEYICANSEDIDDHRDMVDELENYDEYDIVCINYVHPMGWTIERFTKNDERVLIPE